MIPIDLDLHEKTLRDFLGPDQEALVAAALQRLTETLRIANIELRMEKPFAIRRSPFAIPDGDFMAEALEELIDALNRLVMEYNRRKAEGRLRLKPYLAAQLVQRAIMILTGAAFEDNRA